MLYQEQQRLLTELVDGIENKIKSEKKISTLNKDDSNKAIDDVTKLIREKLKNLPKIS